MACKILVFSPNCNFTSKPILLTGGGWVGWMGHFWSLRTALVPEGETSSTPTLPLCPQYTKKKRCFPPSVGCNFLVFFKCFGAIRDRVKILQTFPQKQVYQPFKSTLACIPPTRKNWGYWSNCLRIFLFLLHKSWMLPGCPSLCATRSQALKTELVKNNWVKATERKMCNSLAGLVFSSSSLCNVSQQEKQDCVYSV